MWATRCIGVACACLSLAWGVWSQGTPQRTPPAGTETEKILPGALPREALDAITARGLMLAEYNRALGGATDAVLDGGLAVGGETLALGLKEGQVWRFAFGALDSAGTVFQIAAEAAGSPSSGAFQAKVVSPPREDRETYLAPARACRSAVAAVGPRDRGYAVAPLPDGQGGFFVYLYPVPSRPSSIPLGADFRVQVGADGTSVGEVRRMHMAILANPLPDPSEIPAGGELVMYQTAMLHDGVEDTDVMVVALRPLASKSIVLGRALTYEISQDGRVKVVSDTDTFLREMEAKSDDKQWIRDLRKRLLTSGSPVKKEGAP